jgi:hypothetical protein
MRLTTKNGSRLRKLIQNWLHSSLGRERSQAGRHFQGTESKLLHFVMFAGELFCFRQLLEGLVNVIHGGSSVPTPIAASMFQIVPGTLECSPCGLNFGGHISTFWTKCQSRILVRKRACGRLCSTAGRRSSSRTERLPTT